MSGKMKKGGLFDGAGSEDDEVIFRNINGNPHTPIDAETGEVLLGKQPDGESGTDNASKIKKTPAEKIASVHIDFDRDNILPELNEEDLVKIGVENNKPVLLKKKVIDRNTVEHGDLTDSDFTAIIANALYRPSEIFSANKEKPYYHFAKLIEISSKDKPKIGLALLDVDNRKEKFEIVHAHFIGVKTLDKMVKKAKKKD